MREMKVIRINKSGRKDIELVVGEGERKELVVVVDGVGGGEYEVDIRVVHVGVGGSADVKFRGVVGMGARLKADGLIKIEKGAQEVESFLDMRGLMLDDDSFVEIDPQLEIEANDVKASHSASVSMIDESMLEFLNGFGIDCEVGKSMIVDGFLIRDSSIESS